MSREQATAAARREFGNVAALEERGREAWQWPSIESLIFDIRYALRQLRRQPSFTVVAILMLGLGIGANIAVFSVIDRLLFEPLPFRGSGSARLGRAQRNAPALRLQLHGRRYEMLSEMQTFEELTTYEMASSRVRVTS